MKKKIYTSLWAVLISLFTIAQSPSPGGISNQLSLWIKSNTGTNTATNGNLLTNWAYANDPSKSFSAVPAHAPVYKIDRVNFAPAMTFANQELMDGPTGTDAPITAGNDDYAIIAVWKSDAPAGRNERIWSQRKPDPPPYIESGYGGSLMTWGYNELLNIAPKYGDQVEIAPHGHTVARPYVVSNWNISQLNLLNLPTNDLQIFDDRNLSTGALVLNTDPAGVNGAALRNIVSDLNRLGARDRFNEEAFNGELAELIIYNRSVTNTTEQAKIFSYLAIKYGVTIKTDLVSSAGTVVWNATENATYNNAVFGLGKDDNSALLVNQSNSLETGSGDGTGQSGLGNIVLSDPSALTMDNSFLILGHDNGALAQTPVDVPVAAGGSQRFVREWKVQHTGSVGTVNLSFDFTGIHGIIGVGTVANFRLVVDADGDGNFLTGTQRFYTPTGFTGEVANFTGITLNNNEVFMIITQASAEAPLPVKWISFRGRMLNNDVLLEWEVENNEMAKNYEVQYSSDGIEFSEVGIVMNQQNVKAYNFVHSQPPGITHYYRLHQVDLDGKSVYSKTIFISNNVNNLVVRVLGNPILNSSLGLSITTRRAGDVSIELFSLTGVQMIKRQQALKEGINSITIPVSNVAAGQYFLKVKTNDDVRMLPVIKF
jgi:hypothetical protein